MSQGASEELRAAVDSLVAQGMTSLVLDLRSNPGGLIREGVGVAGPVPRYRRHGGDLRRPVDPADQDLPDGGLGRMGQPASRRAREPRHRQLRRAHRGGPAGPRPRGGGGHAVVREGRPSDDLSHRRRCRPQADHRPLVHAERPHRPAAARGQRRRTRQPAPEHAPADRSTAAGVASSPTPAASCRICSSAPCPGPKASACWPRGSATR